MDRSITFTFVAIAIAINLGIKYSLWRDEKVSNGRRNVFGLKKEGSMKFKTTAFLITVTLMTLISLVILGDYGELGPWIFRPFLACIMGIIVPLCILFSKPKMRNMVTTMIFQWYTRLLEYWPSENSKIYPV